MAEDILILGGGSWGTALAFLLANKDYNVKIWVRNQGQAESISKDGENKKYLPGVKLPSNLKVSTDLMKSVEENKIIVSAIPAQSVRGVLKQIKDKMTNEHMIINVSKGIETDSLMRISEIVKEELGDIDYGVLSGPSHAEEVGRKIPTTVVASSKKKKVAEKIQDLFMSPEFRVYTNPDLIGVELGGALKNIIALCAGISDGLKFGDNTKAALISRGFVEIAKLGVKMGANSWTFSGLSGIGDLIVTCSSMHSRNRRAGILIGEGYGVEEVKEKIGMVVEGIKTTESTMKLAEKLNVEMPITRELYNTLFKGSNVKDSMHRLMLRNKKCEIEEIIGLNEFNWV